MAHCNPQSADTTRGIANRALSDKAGGTPVNPPASGKTKMGKALRATQKRIGLTDMISNRYKG